MNIHILIYSNANSDTHYDTYSTPPPTAGQQRHRQSTYLADFYCCDESSLELCVASAVYATRWTYPVAAPRCGVAQLSIKSFQSYRRAYRTARREINYLVAQRETTSCAAAKLIIWHSGRRLAVNKIVRVKMYVCTCLVFIVVRTHSQNYIFDSKL